MCLDETQEVLVPEVHDEDNSGLYPIDILDPDIPSFTGISAANYYHNMIDWMESVGFTRGETLFGFGFDFRQSNTLHVDRLMKKIKQISDMRNGSKV